MHILFVIYHPGTLVNWITKLQPYLVNNKISVIHIGKLHGINVNTIPGLDLYDISKYSYWRQKKLIERLEPDVVVYLSFRSLYQLVLQRICYEKNIKTVYIEHGLFSQDTIGHNLDRLKHVDKKALFKRNLRYGLSSVERIICSSFFKELRVFYKYVKGDFGVAPYNHYFVYSPRSYKELSRIFLLDEHNTTLVGYPIFLDEEQKTTADQFVDKNKRIGILYVHQPLIKDGIATCNYNDEKDYIVNIAASLKDRYGDLTLLLHPRSELKEYQERFKNEKIEVVQSPNNYRIFADKSLIVGHYSTALLYGLYFNIPTVVLDFPTTKNDPSFSEFFNYVSCIEDLKYKSFSNKEGMKEYVAGNNNTYEHIAKAFLEYCDKIK